MKTSKIVISSLAALILIPSAACDMQAAPLKKEKVTFVRAVDGDTVEVKKAGKTIKARLLLIDTPESVKPGTPVQPYALEAKSYLQKLMKGKNAYIQYDKGGKTDKYGRHLVYLYSGTHMVNEKLVRGGYARVGYVYSQREHLPLLNKQQAKAKKERLRIWSISGYVNPYGEGFITKKAVKTPAKPKVVTPAKPKVVTPAKPKVTASKTNFKNCTELKKYYPNGVYKTHKAYQSKMDRDKDGWACER